VPSGLITIRSNVPTGSVLGEAHESCVASPLQPWHSQPPIVARAPFEKDVPWMVIVKLAKGLAVDGSTLLMTGTGD